MENLGVRKQTRGVRMLQELDIPELVFRGKEIPCEEKLEAVVTKVSGKADGNFLSFESDKSKKSEVRMLQLLSSKMLKNTTVRNFVLKHKMYFSSRKCGDPGNPR